MQIDDISCLRKIYKLVPHLESCTHTDFYTYKSNVYITVKGVSHLRPIYCIAGNFRQEFNFVAFVKAIF